MGKAVIIGRAATAQQNRKAMKWQRECEQINKQKGKQRWWDSFRRRVKIISLLLVASYMLLGGWWMWHSGQIEKAYNVSRVWLLDKTVAAGFALKKVQMSGLKKLPAPVVMNAMGVSIGDPIVNISVSELKKRIEDIPEVRHARVERYFPDELVVAVTEREASVLWQHKGNHQLIDIDGTVLLNQQRAPNKRYMVLAGADVPEHAMEFLEMLDSAPHIKDKVIAATRVGSRRWDVTLNNHMLVKLPQDNAKEAWQKFAQMVVDKQLLDKAIQSIDMRIEDRLFIKVDPSSAGIDKSVDQPLNATLSSARSM